MKIAYSIFRKDGSQGDWSIDTEQMVWMKTAKFDDDGIKCGELSSYFIGAAGIEQISSDLHDNHLGEVTGSWLEVMTEMENKRSEIKSKLAELIADLDTGSEDYVKKLTQLKEAIALAEKGKRPDGLTGNWTEVPLDSVAERARYEISELQKLNKTTTLKRINEQQKLLKRIELCIRAWNKGALK